MRGRILCGVLFAISLSVNAQHKVPEHDLRVGVDFRLIRDAAIKFNDVYYGDTLRMGEFGCGDPSFHVNVTSGPKLTASGFLNTTAATYWSRIHLQAGLHAQITGNCFGHPEANGDVGMQVELKEVPAAKTVDISGNVNVSALPAGMVNLFQRSFPVSFKVPLPTTIDKGMHVKLEPAQGVKFDFGELVEGRAWKSSGNEKDVPFTLRTFSFDFANGTDSRFVIDASVGAPRYREFPTFSDAYAYLRSDDPLLVDSSIGVSASDTFFGVAAADGTGHGLLRELLPIRAVAEKDFTLGSCSMRKQFEIVFNVGSVAIDSDPSGQGVVKLTLGSTFARVTTVGDDPSGPSQFIKGAVGSVTIDRIEVINGTLRFRVSDFRIDANLGGHIVPIRLSTGGLEKVLNGGSFAFGKLEQTFAFEIPDCVHTGYEKTKAAHDCPGPGGYRDAWLSQTKGATRVVFTANVGGSLLKTEPHAIRFSVPLKIDHIDYHP